MLNLYRSLISNHVFSNVVLISLVALGVVAWTSITHESNPEVVVPMIGIVVPYPGADPEEVEDIINELGYFVKEERKGPLLRYLIRQKKRQQILVFASSAKSVDSIVNKLRKNKIDAAPIHSQLSQGARREVLRQFKEASFRVLVATDLIARGIDIEALPCVINYELPRSPKDYIHRIGRTGRAGSPGDAITLITMDELPHFRVIQKKTGKKVPMQHSDGINLHGY